MAGCGSASTFSSSVFTDEMKEYLRTLDAVSLPSHLCYLLHNALGSMNVNVTIVCATACAAACTHKVDDTVMEMIFIGLSKNVGLPYGATAAVPASAEASATISTTSASIDVVGLEQRRQSGSAPSKKTINDLAMKLLCTCNKLGHNCAKSATHSDTKRPHVFTREPMLPCLMDAIKDFKADILRAKERNNSYWPVGLRWKVYNALVSYYASHRQPSARAPQSTLSASPTAALAQSARVVSEGTPVVSQNVPGVSESASQLQSTLSAPPAAAVARAQSARVASEGTPVVSQNVPGVSESASQSTLSASPAAAVAQSARVDVVSEGTLVVSQSVPAAGVSESTPSTQVARDQSRFIALIKENVVVAILQANRRGESLSEMKLVAVLSGSGLEHSIGMPPDSNLLATGTRIVALPVLDWTSKARVLEAFSARCNQFVWCACSTRPTHYLVRCETCHKLIHLPCVVRANNSGFWQVRVSRGSERSVRESTSVQDVAARVLPAVYNFVRDGKGELHCTACSSPVGLELAITDVACASISLLPSRESSIASSKLKKAFEDALSDDAKRSRRAREAHTAARRAMEEVAAVMGHDHDHGRRRSEEVTTPPPPAPLRRSQRPRAPRAQSPPASSVRSSPRKGKGKRAYNPDEITAGLDGEYMSLSDASDSDVPINAPQKRVRRA